MYGNVKERRSRFGGTRSNRSGSKSSNPNLYINKAVEQTVENTQVIRHKFTDFGLSQDIVRSIEARGFTVPTPIQDSAIPFVMNGRDVIGIADTGTGKTAAFLLPLMHKILRDRSNRALIIVPTRELAVQIEDELTAFARNLPIFSALCIGGNGFGAQLKALQRRPQFVIGTPGRLKDHLTRGTLKLHDINNVVLDEADRLVDMGFIQDVKLLISKLNPNRQSLFFSATIPSEVRGLIQSFMNNPETVSVKNRDTSLNVEQDVIRFTDAPHRLHLLHDLLIQPGFDKVLIFGRTKRGVEKLHNQLIDRGFTSVSIHGNKNQAQRQRALNEFKNNKTQVLVATDVAARGLDIPDVTHVINFDAPENYADYVHRIGRTGRANKKGKAYTFLGYA